MAYRAFRGQSDDFQMEGALLHVDARFVQERASHADLVVTLRPNLATLRKEYGLVAAHLLSFVVLRRAVRESSGVLRVELHPPRLTRVRGFRGVPWQTLRLPTRAILWVAEYRARLDSTAPREFRAHRLVVVPVPDEDDYERLEHRLEAQTRVEDGQTWPPDGPVSDARWPIVLTRLGSRVAYAIAERLSDYWSFPLYETRVRTTEPLGVSSP